MPGAALIGDGNHKVLAGDENILFLAVDVGLRLVTPDLHRLGSDLVGLPGLECGVAGEGIAQVSAALERLVFIHVADALDFRQGVERGAAGVVEPDGFFDQRRQLGIDKPHVAIDGALQRLARIALDNEGHRGLAFEEVESLNQLLRDATGEGLERGEMPVDDLVLVDPDIERALALAVALLVFVAGRVPIAPRRHRAIGLELPLDAAADHVAIGFDVRERGFGASGGIGLGGAVLDLPIPAMVAGEVEDCGINGVAVLEDAAGDREPEPNVLTGGEGRWIDSIAAVALGGAEVFAGDCLGEDDVPLALGRHELQGHEEGGNAGVDFALLGRHREALADLLRLALAKKFEALRIPIDREGRVEDEGIGLPRDFREDGGEEGDVGREGVPVALGVGGLVGNALVDVASHEVIASAPQEEISGAHLQIDGAINRGEDGGECGGVGKRRDELLLAFLGGVAAVEGFL